jgi:hypothetical protein
MEVTHVGRRAEWLFKLLDVFRLEDLDVELMRERGRCSELDLKGNMQSRRQRTGGTKRQAWAPFQL